MSNIKPKSNGNLYMKYRVLIIMYSITIMDLKNGLKI